MSITNKNSFERMFNIFDIIIPAYCCPLIFRCRRVPIFPIRGVIENNISVKAKTNEKTGAVGRGELAEAMAVALVEKTEVGNGS